MLVAASDALASTKTKADYTCTGTDDQEQIEAAINALHSSGGIVLLSEGTFNLSDTISLNATKIVSLQGEGPSVTVLDMDIQSTEDAIKLVSGHHHEVKGMGIEGTYRVGVLLQNAGYCVLDSLRVVEPTLAGVRAETGNCVNRLHNIEVVDSSNYGFWLYGNANRIEACHARRPSGKGGGAGFRIHDSGSTYSNVASDKHAQAVYITQYAEAVTINGLYAEDCTKGIYIQSTGTPKPAAVNIHGVYLHDCDTPFDIRDGSGISIQGVQLE